jgi:hypothetical protein
MYTAMRPGIFGVDSLIADVYTPNSYELYDARIQSTEWYYHNASQVIDLAILGTVVTYGAQLLQTTLPDAIRTEIEQRAEMQY